MIVAIAGGTGFLGKWILKSLIEKKISIFCLVRKESIIDAVIQYPEIQVKIVDFEDDESIREGIKGANSFIHLIGQMGEYGINEEQFWNINCALTERLIKVSSICGIKQFIYCSTPGVQGFGKRWCVESEPCRPRNIYEKTKEEAERIVMNECRERGIAYTILRPDFVYGPGDLRRIKMYQTIQKGRFVLTTSGEAFIHPTYVKDVAEAFALTIGDKKAHNEIFNVSAERDYTVLEYLQTIARHTSSRLVHINMGYKLSVLCVLIIEFIFNDLLKREPFVSKNKIDFLAFDHSTSNEKIRKTLDFKAQYSLEDGMSETIAWCREEGFLGEKE